MYILTIRTDKPEAEVGIFRNSIQLDYEVWEAHRQLAETVHLKIRSLLDRSELKLADLEGIVAYAGPGSFTGLRIGTSVANALASSLDVPIVGGSGEDWLAESLTSIQNLPESRVVLPEYGSLPNITAPRK